MNQRTTRLLVRIAHLAHLRDPARPKQPVASRLSDLKASWNRTPRQLRHETRKGLVAIGQALIGGHRG